ncbi:Carbamoyl-phosphate synthase L chain, ATP binding domain [Halomonas caseinilytica]|nr:Carbamoyl-phosphate synthase L chain, ATP binding domain [Halomonas caseinilytica]
MRLSPFSCPLVAGRGVAALRVRQACAERGMQPVAARGTESSLIEEARAAGCDALHPGECDAARQAALAERCRHLGLRFLGGEPRLLDAMAEGRVMRQKMREAGLPLAASEPGGEVIAISLLADRFGRVLYLSPRRHRDHISMAPLGELTKERYRYLGELAARGIARLGVVGLVEARFRIEGNRLGFLDMRPGPTGDEALDEVLMGVDPLVEQLRVLSGERLRERQSRLAVNGQARLWRLVPPSGGVLTGGPGVRLDRCEEGGEARLVVWGRRSGDVETRARRVFVEWWGESEARRWLAI